MIGGQLTNVEPGNSKFYHARATILQVSSMYGSNTDLSRFRDKNPLSTSCYVNDILMLWNGNYEFKIWFYN